MVCDAKEPVGNFERLRLKDELKDEKEEEVVVIVYVELA